MIIGSVSGSNPRNARTAAARRRRTAVRLALARGQTPEDTAKPGLLDRSRQLVGRVLNTITGRESA
jgi:hypothetical protein